MNPFLAIALVLLLQAACVVSHASRGREGRALLAAVVGVWVGVPVFFGYTIVVLGIHFVAWILVTVYLDDPHDGRIHRLWIKDGPGIFNWFHVMTFFTNYPMSAALLLVGSRSWEMYACMVVGTGALSWIEWKGLKWLMGKEWDMKETQVWKWLKGGE